MFRTKSLSSQEMKSLIDRNRPSQIQKQNSNYSLRSMIADKTIKYHKHMQKLIQESNNISLSYSGKKSTKKATPKNVLQQKSNFQNNSNGVKQFSQQVPVVQQSNQELNHENQVNQFSQQRTEGYNQKNTTQQSRPFEEEIEMIYVQSLPTYINQRSRDIEGYSFLDASKITSMDKSAFKMSLQNQQLYDQNKQLRRQIQHLQQRLQTAQLIRMQKQSQAQSLRLKLKIVELKVQDYEQKEQQRQAYHTKFSLSKLSFCHINNQIINKTMEIQTEETSSHIQYIYNMYQNKCKEVASIINQVTELQAFMSSNCNENIIKNISIDTDQFNEVQNHQAKTQKQSNTYLPNQLSNITTSKNIQQFFRSIGTNSFRQKRALQNQQLRNKQLEQLYSQLSISFSKLRQDNQICNKNINQQQIKIMEFRDICAKLETAVATLSNQRDILLRKLDQYSYANNQLLQEIGQYKQYAYELELKNQQSKQLIITLENELNQKIASCNRLEQEHLSLEQAHKQDIHKYNKKIGILVNLLQLAQKQIKNLLSRLRQAKDHDIAHYREIFSQVSGRINCVINSTGRETGICSELSSRQLLKHE